MTLFKFRIAVLRNFIVHSCIQQIFLLYFPRSRCCGSREERERHGSVFIELQLQLGQTDHKQVSKTISACAKYCEGNNRMALIESDSVGWGGAVGAAP